MFGIDDRCIRFSFKPPLIGHQSGLHGTGALDDLVRRLAHLGDQPLDLLPVRHQLGQGVAVARQQRTDLLDDRADPFVCRRNILQPVVEEAETAKRAGPRGLIAAGHEVVGGDLD